MVQRAAITTWAGGMAALILAACGGGPGESDYVEACMTQRDATKAQCECAAKETKAGLSDDAFQAMILDMQGKHQEASDIMQSLPAEEQAKAIGIAMEVFGKCVMGQ